jgi:hypothetical protein
MKVELLGWFLDVGILNELVHFKVQIHFMPYILNEFVSDINVLMIFGRVDALDLIEFITQLNP